MKQLKQQHATLLFVLLLLLLLTGCQQTKSADMQSDQLDLADLPATQDFTITVEGLEETSTYTKAQHDDFYAIYYDAEAFTYVPGEITDNAFSDRFISVYDDETTMVPTTMLICYTPDCTPEDWIATNALGEFAPRVQPYTSVLPQWELTDQEITLGDDTHTWQLWDGTAVDGTGNYCYTTSYHDGCLALLLSYPAEYAEGWSTRMTSMAQTIVLADA